MKRNIRYFLMIVGLMLSVGIFAQTTKWRDIYTVKKKDTIFGIANKYGLSLPELMEANPEMKQEGYMLQKGTTLLFLLPATSRILMRLKRHRRRIRMLLLPVNRL